MAHAHRPNHRFQQVSAARLQRRHLRPQRGDQRIGDPAALLDPEDVDPHHPFVKRPVLFDDRLRHAQEPRHCRIGAGEEMVVNLQPARTIKITGPEVGRGQQRHVAVRRAVRARPVRVVEARNAVTGNAAEQKRVVVILTPQPLVAVHLLGQVHLVTSAAKLGGTVQRLEKRLLVQLGLGLDQLPIHPAQRRLLAEGERVVAGRRDRVVRVAPHAVDVRYRMTGGAGDPRLRQRVPAQVVVRVVELRIVKRTAEERHRVVATRAKARAANVPVSLHHAPPSLLHAELVGGVVERGEAMRTVGPGLVDIRMTTLAVAVHHQRLGGDEVARVRPRR